MKLPKNFAGLRKIDRFVVVLGRLNVAATISEIHAEFPLGFGVKPFAKYMPGGRLPSDNWWYKETYQLLNKATAYFNKTKEPSKAIDGATQQMVHFSLTNFGRKRYERLCEEQSRSSNCCGDCGSHTKKIEPKFAPVASPEAVSAVKRAETLESLAGKYPVQEEPDTVRIIQVTKGSLGADYDVHIDVKGLKNLLRRILK